MCRDDIGFTLEYIGCVGCRVFLLRPAPLQGEGRICTKDEGKLAEEGRAEGLGFRVEVLGSGTASNQLGQGYYLPN